LDDYLLRSATLKASLVTVRKTIKSLPKLDTGIRKSQALIAFELHLTNTQQSHVPKNRTKTRCTKHLAIAFASIVPATPL
jgi:hypothetical protein